MVIANKRREPPISKEILLKPIDEPPLRKMVASVDIYFGMAFDLLSIILLTENKAAMESLMRSGSMTSLKMRFRNKMQEARELQRSGDLSKYLKTLFEAERLSEEMMGEMSKQSVA